MRLLVVLAFASCVACGKSWEKADAGAGVTPFVRDTKAYPPAVLDMKSCPPRPSPFIVYTSWPEDQPTANPPIKVARPPAAPGCEACAPDEDCAVTEVRGHKTGRCTKSSCQKDSDCRGALCACGPPNECLPGNCRGPDDCGGRECAPNRGRHGHGRGSYCRTEADTCKVHENCALGHECVFDGARWACRPAPPAPPPG